MTDTAQHAIPASQSDAWSAVPDSVQGTGARTLTFSCDQKTARYAFGTAAPSEALWGHNFPCTLTTEPVAWDLADGERLWVHGRAGTKITIDRS